MVLGKIISSEGYTFGQKWIISMIFRSFFITCIHKYDPNSVAASKMISIFMIFYYLCGIFWYCEVRSVGSLTLIKSRFGRGVSNQIELRMGNKFAPIWVLYIGGGTLLPFSHSFSSSYTIFPFFIRLLHFN